MAAFKDWGVMAGYEEAGQLLSAAFVFPTSEPGLYCLHALCTDPAARGRGMAEAVVRFVCQELRSRGAGTLTWTYDAADPVNAHLYHNKLGGLGVSVEYDCYGAFEADNQGSAPSHRVVCMLPLGPAVAHASTGVRVEQTVTLAAARCMPPDAAAAAYDHFYQQLERALSVPGRAIRRFHRGATEGAAAHFEVGGIDPGVERALA